MIRLLVLAISALMAVSAGAASATELTVKIAGKSVPQVHADLVSAARTVCRMDLSDSRPDQEMMPYCVREVTRTAVGKVRNPELTAYDKAYGREAFLTRVSR